MKRIAAAGALLALLHATSASALGVFLLADDYFGAVGDVVAVEIVLDFSAEPAIGGGINIAYDSAMLSVVGYTFNNIGSGLNRYPDFLDGLLSGWGFISTSPVAGPALWGSLSFEIIASGTSTIDISEDIGGPAGAFSSWLTFQPYLPGQLDFSSSVLVSTVPVPATAWLLIDAVAERLSHGAQAFVPGLMPGAKRHVIETFD